MAASLQCELLMSETQTVKVRDAMQNRSAFAAYRALMYGDTSLGYMLYAEIVQACLSGMPGAGGILLRSWFYKTLFGSVDGKVTIGRNVVLRHPRKIRLGRGVILDDNCMVDAKGQDNRGITFGDGVFIGRGTIVYCKNGNITLGDRVSLSSSCTLFSSNDLTIGRGTLIGAYSYILSGGEYDPADPRPFSEQDGMQTAGRLTIEADCWLGARVTVLDAAGHIGARCTIGAGAVVRASLPANSTAVGVPARVVKTRTAATA
jgi:acetyltransferase-like isoleucine patch superfamily enzyme